MVWQEYIFQTVLDVIDVEAIVAAVDDQYVEELSEDYIGYKNQTIATMITHLQTWFLITNKEKLDAKALFYAPWSENPNTHITTLARQLNRRQVECATKQVTITDSDKVDHFVAQMYLCDIFESKFLDDLEEAQDKTWAAPKTLFVTQYKKEQRKLDRESKRTPYESNALFHEITALAPQNIAHDTSDEAAYEAAIEYAQALEEQTTVQAAEILALKSVGGTTTTVVSDFAAAWTVVCSSKACAYSMDAS